MGVRVEVDSDLEARPDRRLFQLVRTACRLAAKGSGIEADVEFACVLTSGSRLHQLNRQFRSVDAPTDVLAFPRNEDQPGGDVAIAMDIAAEKAARAGHSLEREVAYLAAHAALHLLGHDHKAEGDYRRMRQAEESVLAAMGLPEPGDPSGQSSSAPS